jgi:hypothetical protein
VIAHVSGLPVEELAPLAAMAPALLLALRTRLATNGHDQKER